MIIKTNLVPASFSATTCWPFIFVRPDKADDKALMAHEMVHYEEQAWITPYWLLRYWLSKSFRLAAEVRGYRAQIAAGVPLFNAAFWLTNTDYGFDLSIEQAQALLA